MTDQLAGQGDPAASASAPGPNAADIETIRKEFDERFKGLQRVIAAKDEAISARDTELKQLKLAGLSEEEREQLADQEKDLEIQGLKARLELRDLAGEYGTELPFFEKLLAGGSAKDQLEVMREFAKTQSGQASGTPAPAAGTPEIPDVDANRPLRPFAPGTTLSDGRVMTEELADQILGSVGKQASITQR